MKTMAAVPGATRAVTGGVSCCSQLAVSRHLAALRRAGLIERADGERSCEGDANGPDACTSGRSPKRWRRQGRRSPRPGRRSSRRDTPRRAERLHCPGNGGHVQLAAAAEDAAAHEHERQLRTGRQRRAVSIEQIVVVDENRPAVPAPELARDPPRQLAPAVFDLGTACYRRPHDLDANGFTRGQLPVLRIAASKRIRLALPWSARAGRRGHRGEVPSCELADPHVDLREIRGGLVPGTDPCCDHRV